MVGRWEMARRRGGGLVFVLWVKEGAVCEKHVLCASESGAAR